MNSETISIVLNEKEQIEDVRKALAEFKINYPEAKIAKPKFGELSRKILITFKVDKDYTAKLITTFTRYYIKILATTNVIKDKVNEATSQYVEVLARQDKGWDELKIEQPKMSISELEAWAEEGEYSEILKVANNLIQYGEELSEKAKGVLQRSLLKAIENAIALAEEDEKNASRSISDLIHIATDPKLKVLQKVDIMKKAGIAAIEVAKKYEKHIYDLVRIANNTDLHNMINVVAAVEFAKIVMQNKEKYEKDITTAARVMNIRWLGIAYDVAKDLISKEDQKIFFEVIDFLKAERSKIDSD